MTVVDDFIGQGWSHPVVAAANGPRWASGAEKIRQAIWLVLSTAKGERVIEGVKILPWDLLRSALGALDKREKDQLVTILKKLAAHVAGQINKEVNPKEVRHGSRG